MSNGFCIHPAKREYPARRCIHQNQVSPFWPWNRLIINGFGRSTVKNQNRLSPGFAGYPGKEKEKISRARCPAPLAWSFMGFAGGRFQSDLFRTIQAHQLHIDYIKLKSESHTALLTSGIARISRGLEGGGG